MPETSDSELVSTRQQRIAELAKQAPQMGFTSLNHPRSCLAAGGVSTHAQRRSRGRRRADGCSVRGAPGGQPPEALRAGQVWHVPGTAGATSVHSERHGWRHPPDWNSHAGGQMLQTGDRHAAGADLRAGLSRRLVRVSAWTIGAPGVGEPLGTDNESRRRLDSRSGHPKVFRYAGSCPSASVFPQRVRDGVVLRLIGKWLNAGVMETGR